MEVVLLSSRVASPNAWTVSSLQGYVLLFQQVCFSAVILQGMEASQEVGLQVSWRGRCWGGLMLENCPDGALPFQIGNELCTANSPPLAWVMGSGDPGSVEEDSLTHSETPLK